MKRNRRAFLSAVGALTVGGCVGSPPDTPSGDAPPATGDSDTSAPPPSTQESTQKTTTEPEPTTTTIGFAGDTMVGRRLNNIYGDDDVDPASIWGEFQPRLQSVDGVLCNLECSLSTRGERYPGRAFYFRGDPEWAIPALEAGNVQYTSLANNHALDFGATALMDTITHLDDAGIANAGTGANPEAAREPATLTVGDLDVAVVSFSDEYDFYAATDDRPGIAWISRDYDSEETRRKMRDAIDRAKATDPDLLVFSIHWGENWIERPSEKLVKLGHWLVDQGVDVVHGHSAHVVQGIEQYEDGIILHDTGDLVDDFGIKDNLGNDKSFLFEMTFEGDEPTKIRLVPLHIDDGVRPPTDEEVEWLRETMRDRAEPFDTTYERADDGLVVHL
ncbi:CapA family protein [Haladaptatus sp. YSMS36]|uniref:CapA family protein n=1 Tax=Haladaptatus sp. YSMS36 TaxID=3033384 RepID=UPI0023E7CF17|nr:CapA family protein [Haladaptatus sp. YSMS36]